MTFLSCTNTWSHEAKAFVETHWTAGRSASEIVVLLAAQLKTVKSRNAVIGVVHRMGLKDGGRQPRSDGRSDVRRAPSAPTAKPALKLVQLSPPPQSPQVAREPKLGPPTPVIPRIPAAAKVARPAPPAPPTPSVPETPLLRTEAVHVPGAKTCLELAARDCRFPVGSATGAGQLHCGKRTVDGEVYCATHRRVAGGWKIDGAKYRTPRGAYAGTSLNARAQA
jgi:hypothetical protein